MTILCLWSLFCLCFKANCAICKDLPRIDSPSMSTLCMHTAITTFWCARLSRHTVFWNDPLVEIKEFWATYGHALVSAPGIESSHHVTMNEHHTMEYSEASRGEESSKTLNKSDSRTSLQSVLLFRCQVFFWTSWRSVDICDLNYQACWKSLKNQEHCRSARLNSTQYVSCCSCLMEIVAQIASNRISWWKIAKDLITKFQCTLSSQCTLGHC